MEIEFEILAILATAFFFTITGLVLEDKKTTITLKMLAAIAWFALALGFTASTPSFLAFSFLFMGAGIILTFTVIQDVVSMLDMRRQKRFNTKPD